MSASASGDITVWDLLSRRPALERRAAHDCRVLHLAVHAGSGRVVSQGRGGHVCVWDPELQRSAPEFELRTGCYNFCRFDLHAPQSALPTSWSVLLPGEETSVVAAWCPGSAEPALRLIPPRHQAMGMCTSATFVSRAGVHGLPDVVAGYEDGTLAVWDARVGKLRAALRIHDELVLQVCMTGHSSGVSASADTKLGVFSWAAGPDLQLSRTLPIPVGHEDLQTGGVNRLALRDDGRIIASAGWDRRVRIWQCHNWKPLAVLRHHTDTVNDVSFSPHTQHLASASKDKTIALWDVFCTSHAGSAVGEGRSTWLDRWGAAHSKADQE